MGGNELQIRQIWSYSSTLDTSINSGAGAEPVRLDRTSGMMTSLARSGVWLWGLGFKFWVWGLGSGVWSLGFWVWGLGFGFWGLGFGLGF